MLKIFEAISGSSKRQQTWRAFVPADECVRRKLWKVGEHNHPLIPAKVHVKELSKGGDCHTVRPRGRGDPAFAH